MGYNIWCACVPGTIMRCKTCGVYVFWVLQHVVCMCSGYSNEVHHVVCMCSGDSNEVRHVVCMCSGDSNEVHHLAYMCPAGPVCHCNCL